ncbi:MAG: hypothetical protein ACI4S2_13545 [Lachnospiraceae bacterium]
MKLKRMLPFFILIGSLLLISCSSDSALKENSSEEQQNIEQTEESNENEVETDTEEEAENTEDNNNVENQGNDTEKNQESSMSEFDKKIEEIRQNYDEIKNNLSKMQKFDAGEVVQYLQNDKIRKIVAPPGTYDQMDGYGDLEDYTAEYYYTKDERPVFVFVYNKKEQYRFYIQVSEETMSKCIRYIDENGVVHDYPEGKAVDEIEEISKVGGFFMLAYQELHWAGRL